MNHIEAAKVIEDLYANPVNGQFLKVSEESLLPDQRKDLNQLMIHLVNHCPGSLLKIAAYWRLTRTNQDN